MPLLLLLLRLRRLHHRYAQIPKMPFSSLSASQLEKSQTSDSIPKPTSLSSRMSFVFDQIDAIEKERSQKDETLQRIRSWRESKKQPFANPAESVVSPEPTHPVKILEQKNEDKNESDNNVGLLSSKKEVELVHPWPEWIGLMERLVQQNYFDHRRKDEDKMIENLGFNLTEMVEEEGFDFTRDFKTVQTAVLNFGRDRFDILRSLSRQDLQILVGYGCPSVDKKVVFSSKLLRKHVHLDEGDVCSSCTLRSSCERGYLLTNKEDEARTMDVMRVLLTYSFDAVNGSVGNKSLLKMKSVKTVVRKLLNEVVKLSAVPIDPNLPPPVIKKPPPKVKQPPPTPKKRVGRDDIEMKKGDWLCPKCDFMNFAKNTVCLQCDAKRPKRQLLPGEWECPQCNFLNYRRNMVCFHCEHNRPPDEFMESQVQERQRGPKRLEKISDRKELSNAWNFDFDDNESDGADVAAFEYADSRKMKEDFPLEKGRGHEDGYYKGSRPAGLNERENSNVGPARPGTGFNDFDDEDDDLDNYELDTQNDGQKASRVDFSELEVDSVSEDEERTNNNWPDRRQSDFRAQNKRSKSNRKEADAEIDFGSDDDLPVHPNWKSSHVTQFNRRNKRRAISFGTDDELSSGSDGIEDNDSGTREKRGNKWSSNRKSLRQGNYDTEDEPFSDMESNNDAHFGKDRFSNRGSLRGRGNSSAGRGMVNKRSSSKDILGRSSWGNRGKGFEDDHDSHRRNGRNGDFRKSRSPRREGSGKGFEDDHDSHRRNGRNGDFRNSISPRREGSGKGFEDDHDSHRRNGRNGDFRNSRSPRREDRFSNSNKQKDSYLDEERFRRPRDNVR